MADNIAVTPGTGAVVAAEACSGTANALVQRIKLVLGATDTDGGNVSSVNPLPVLSGTAGNFLVSAVGTVTVVSGTAANLLASITGTVGVNTIVVVSSGTAANFLAQVSGTVTATGTVTAVSGTAANFLAQVSGTVTATGTVTAVSGTAANLLSQVSGTVTAVSGTAANLLVQASGTITATGTVTVVSGTAANLLSQVSGSVTAVSGTAGNFLASVSGTVTATGTVTVVSGTAANLLSLVTVTAGTNQIGQVISGQQMSIYNGTAALAIQYANVSFTSSGGNTVITGVASKNIYVLSGLIICQGATNVQFWQNTTASTAMTGVMAMTANAGFQIPYVPIGNFATTSTGQAIQLSSSVATTVGGWLTYVAF